MTTAYQRILVAVDGSPTSTAGLREAIRLAALTGGKLCLMHVLDSLAYANGFETAAALGEMIPRMKQTGRHLLEACTAEAAAAGVNCDEVLVEDPAERVCDLVVAQARSWPADLIVIGTHGRRGVERMMLGSAAEQILRSAPVPVLLVRAPGAASEEAVSPAAARAASA